MNNGLSDEERELLNTPHNSSPNSSQGAAGNADSTHPVDPSTESASRALSDLHREFASKLAATLSTCTRQDVEVRLKSNELSPFSQFVFGQTVPCCCAVVCSEPTQLEFYLALRPSILYPILDVMMGAVESAPIPQRPMTEVERGLVEVLCEQLMAAYEDAWRPVLALQLGLDRLEHNVQQNPFLPGGEMTYRVRFDVRLGHNTGTMELCLPWQASQQLRQQLDAQAGGG